MKLRKLSRTKDQASPDEEVLGIEESLQSIAVELHRGNILAGQALAQQQRQVELIANFLDITRLQMQTATSGNSDGLRVIEGLLDPLRSLMESQVSRAAQITTSPAKAPTVTHESEHLRVAQNPDVAEAEV